MSSKISKNRLTRRELGELKIPCSVVGCKNYSKCFINRKPYCLYHYEALVHPNRDMVNKYSERKV
jgi:hypothetical protein